MTFYKPILVTTAALALAACGGTSAEDIILSDGAIEGLELPSEDDLANLPDEAQDLLSDLQDANESLSRTASLPPGAANYAGTIGLEVASEDGDEETPEAYLFGDMNVVAQFDAADFDGSMTGIVGQTADGDPLGIGGDLTIAGTIDAAAESQIQATIGGDLTLEGETYVVGGDMLGVFAGDGAARALGTIEGDVENPDGRFDGVSGVFLGDKQ